MIVHIKKRTRSTTKSKPSSNKRPKLAAISKKHVTQNVLPWSEVRMPEKLDDAEGFLGLEEVDGVDVVREGNFLRFITSAADNKVPDDEFLGFSDDEYPNEHVDLESKAPEAKEEASKEQPLRKNKTEKDKKNVQGKKKKKLLDDSLKNHSFKPLSEVSHKEVDIKAWLEINLTSDMFSALSKLGFSKPTLIQSAAIPEILDGHDVIGKASTGSGKTLAFSIPIVESWMESNEDLDNETRPPQILATALILSPTRELAHQITDHINALCNQLSSAPRVVSVTGGLSIQKQQRLLSKADIIIATPGRLLEVVNSCKQTLKSIRHIKFLVIDEADRLLSDGHFKEAEEILNLLDSSENIDENNRTPSSRQTLVFSATFQKTLQQKLAGRSKRSLKENDAFMENLMNKLKFREEIPKYIDVNPVSQMAENLKEGIVECKGTEKDFYLYALLLQYSNKRTLVFTNSIHSVRRLTPMLQNLGLNAQALHSQMAQKARMRSIERFSCPISKGSILIATDVAARGLDIKDVQLVVHYHLPRAADIYVHRSGRTARQNSSGTSILICAPEEVIGMRRLIAKVHAQSSISGKEIKSKYYMKSLDINRTVVSRLKPRVTLAKKIADSALAKQKSGHEQEWLKNAAEELGVDYDSDTACGGGKGRGNGRRLRENEVKSLTKHELYAMKEELKSLLAHRVNVGISEKYLAGTGIVNVNELLSGVSGDFLGTVDGIMMD
ncbi:ATP-dependent RNA helicase mak5 [Erysiphe neolycopersici]|uniref:ATP-dependent RNA helicase n=1 Tax=Erysiphe neolycopersici TaxID=212602 RepID=A0A420HP48_9PEZI|nr:ATP-dependent RNA helicase mak5 [Erysiphe neolycopersici]